MSGSAGSDPARSVPEQLLAEMPAGLLVLGRDGRVVFENERLRELWRPFRAPSHPGAFPDAAHRLGGAPLRPEDWPVWRSLRTGTEVIDEEIELGPADSDTVSILASSVPVRGAEDTVEGALMVVTDITDRHDHDELRAAFVDVVSHELRTPITSIYGGIELLRQRDLPPEARLTLLDDVASEAENLTRIVEDLLIVVRLQADVELARGEPVLLQRIVHAAVADERRRWPSQSFVVEVPDDLPVVEGDEALIRQVLRNLLSNAAKFGAPGGEVLVTASATPDAVVMRVSDDGPGLADSDGQYVFRLFHGAPADAPGGSGTGIGLYVSRALVEAMGGRITAMGRPEGGMEIAFRLPRLREPADPDG